MSIERSKKDEECEDDNDKCEEEEEIEAMNFEAAQAGIEQATYEEITIN